MSLARPAALVLLAAALWSPAAAALAASPPVSRTRLANGLTVLVRENPVAPIVAISLTVPMGTRWETPETAGISNLLQLMLVRGTTSRSGIEIVQAADRMGGSIDGFADADTSDIAATALSRHWVEMLELVADVALRPSVPQDVTAAVREFALRQIRNRGDRPYDAGFDAVTGALFGRHPYAWPTLGRPESVARLDREALLAHYRRHYVPGTLVLTVSGEVETRRVLAEAERLFGGMAASPPPAVAPPPPPALEATRAGLEVPGAQAQIFLGGLAPPMTDPDYPAVKVLSTVLGGGMAGRFFSEIRDKQALAYTTGIQYPSRLDASGFVAFLGTAPENLEAAEAALRRELERIQREPARAEEVEVAKAYLLGRLALDRRTNARQAWYLGTYEAAGLGHEFLDRYVAAVRRVTVADVQRVARRYLDTLRTVIVRPPAR